ncbi:MAG: RecX family transcriptional regulator [Lachnospiraceae bacterium]|nr:RecX family transcriptional regulator [Lachnospiraceae bacterium]
MFTAGDEMIVTEITEYNKGKYKIYLNDEFAFVLYKGELYKYKIKEGDELSEDEIRDIKVNIILKRARLRAMNLLKNRDYTEKALRNKLNDSLYPADIVDEAVKYVKSYGYVDDLRYASNFIAGNRTAKSRKEIMLKLRQKGIEESIIEEAFNGEDFDEEEEYKLIQKLILKKYKKLNFNDPSVRHKICGYMYSKGFSIEKVNCILNRISEEDSLIFL